MRVTSRLCRRLAVVAIGIGACAAALCWLWRPSTASLLAEAREAVSVSDYERGLALASLILRRHEGSVEALLIAAEAARQSGHRLQALEFYRQLPETVADERVASALKDAGQIAIHLGRASDAESFYKRALRLSPDDLVIHRRLGALYLAQSRRWESAPHLFALVRGQTFTLEELAFLGNLEEVCFAEELMMMFEHSVSDDVAPLMGRARLHLFKNFPEEGEALLRRILAQNPELIEAQAQFGVVLVSESRDGEVEDWHRNLPPAADSHPEIWWVRATQARKHGDSRGAIRCAWEALRLDPNHLGATYQLAQLLAAQGVAEQARLFARRASKLEVLGSTIHDILLRERSAERMLRCARLCEELGRLWEAWAWHVAIDTYHPEQAVPGERARLKALLTPETPQTLPSHSLAHAIDLAHYPLPSWGALRDAGVADAQALDSGIRFEEVGAAVGLDFQYDNGADANTPGLMIYQSVGGGVAVIDYDGDGAPDLFFPQAGSWPPDPGSSAAADRLYRNVGGRCLDVTDFAIPTDWDFGFGASVGDFNSDGFHDLYIANAGRNRLLRNNGDGTFSDITAEAGLTAEEWTVSCLIADLNGDGLPDLYDVNYCAGQRPFEHVCLRADGRLPRTCVPTEFVAADDHLLVNLGDGRFAEVGSEAGIRAPEGRGLGIVAAQLDDHPGLDLYIANDMTANFLFLNRTSAPGATPQFEEHGVLSGTAYDSDGRPQASMGIAADDFDGDGLIDLFLTHFYNESNTFYRQHAGGFFVDESRQVNLRHPSMSFLGWGTQFLDAELDGRPDLVVVNGHVDDFTEQEIPFRMKPQFFNNRGGQFVEIPSEQLSAFFTTEQLGRGLARLDWDGDGREDFVVSRLFEPAALVLNRTPQTGRFIAVRLIGRTDRDAIGAEVRVSADGRTLVKQLMAGDGFASSNHRQLVFGLADADHVKEVRIRWSGGAEQVFVDVPIGRTLLFIEGRDRCLSLP